MKDCTPQTCTWCRRVAELEAVVLRQKGEIVFAQNEREIMRTVAQESGRHRARVAELEGALLAIEHDVITTDYPRTLVVERVEAVLGKPPRGPTPRGASTEINQGGDAMRASGEKPYQRTDSAGSVLVAGKRPTDADSQNENVDALAGGPAVEGSGGLGGAEMQGVEPEATCGPRPSEAEAEERDERAAYAAWHDEIATEGQRTNEAVSVPLGPPLQFSAPPGTFEEVEQRTPEAPPAQTDELAAQETMHKVEDLVQKWSYGVHTSVGALATLRDLVGRCADYPRPPASISQAAIDFTEEWGSGDREEMCRALERLLASVWAQSGPPEPENGVLAEAPRRQALDDEKSVEHFKPAARRWLESYVGDVDFEALDDEEQDETVVCLAGAFATRYAEGVDDERGRRTETAPLDAYDRGWDAAIFVAAGALRKHAQYIGSRPEGEAVAGHLEGAVPIVENLRRVSGEKGEAR